ncbi:MAG: cupredoxin domain-containing protein [Candidatus Eremiobacteraeota bacterium]|nr:cupredoxin domain-containing protein [Candidatus Eremiobacteraeota bacterium]
MLRRWKNILIRACFLATLSLACVSCGAKTQSGQVTIVINSNAYSPGSVTVTQGTLVTWINQDSQPHTVTAIGAFDSGPIAPAGGRWSWVAAQPGTFQYHSVMQPNMAGSITIVVSGPTSY